MNKNTTSFISPLPDRWHYFDFNDQKHDKFYVEWKYFNFVQNDLAGYIVYYLIDPVKRSKIQGVRLVAGIFANSKKFSGVEKIGFDKVQLDDLGVGIEMDKAKIVVHDQHHYEANGGLDNLAWRLNYRQTTPSIEAFSNIPSGMLRWEKADWLIKMPRAEVEGAVKLNNRNFNIKTLGYTDTNWGEIMPLSSSYEWGNYNGSEVSLIFGAINRPLKAQSAYLYLILNGETVILEKPAMKTTRQGWTRDQKSGLKFPAGNDFQFTREPWAIKVSTTLVDYTTNSLTLSRFLPKVVVVEKLVRYEGQIEKNSRLIKKFSGSGFEEYSARTWKKNFDIEFGF